MERSLVASCRRGGMLDRKVGESPALGCSKAAERHVNSLYGSGTDFPMHRQVELNED